MTRKLRATVRMRYRIWLRKFRLLAAGLSAAAVLAVATAAAATGAVPLRDPILLSIGLNCQWETRCMALQKKAMKRALTYISRSKPPTARIHRCNRNAARARARVDWVGFDHCIRNHAMGR
jgi:hypothetical protein